jgi:hypothetical protein
MGAQITSPEFRVVSPHDYIVIERKSTIEYFEEEFGALFEWRAVLAASVVTHLFWWPPDPIQI